VSFSKTGRIVSVNDTPRFGKAVVASARAETGGQNAVRLFSLPIAKTVVHLLHILEM
jgi:hypothetical protein